MPCTTYSKARPVKFSGTDKRRMNKAQKIDYAYHVERLLLLIARRDKLPADSDQVPALNIEIMSIADLVRSYRLVREHENRQA
jgi:hypothetical protein